MGFVRVEPKKSVGRFLRGTHKCPNPLKGSWGAPFYVLCAVALVNGTVLVATVERKSRLLSKLGYRILTLYFGFWPSANRRNMTKGKDDLPLETHGAVEEPTPFMVIPSEAWIQPHGVEL
ncbi:hypothetical protein PIB30_033724 [Stylosanthes scabra]|uniref:Uncharacterized protein n=1 Tax=Stylosanthes scabra TaxID=79078 RepID=A0ABU6ZB36_9FABA|nr:hypothetical protein [Stylosanthes scabra]